MVSHSTGAFVTTDEPTSTNHNYQSTLSLWKNNIVGYLKYSTPFSCLHSFYSFWRDVQCNSYSCPSVSHIVFFPVTSLKVFDFLNLNMMYVQIFLLFIFLRVPWLLVPVTWCLSLILKTFQSFLCKEYLLLLSSISAISIIHMLYLFKLFHSYWIFCRIFFFLPLCISVLEVSMDISSKSLISFLSCDQSSEEPIKGFFICYNLLISSISFQFFLRIFISLPTTSILYVVYLSTKALSVFIIVFKKFLVW